MGDQEDVLGFAKKMRRNSPKRKPNTVFKK
jgi:hypothetical protein